MFHGWHGFKSCKVPNDEFTLIWFGKRCWRPNRKILWRFAKFPKGIRFADIFSRWKCINATKPLNQLIYDVVSGRAQPVGNKQMEVRIIRFKDAYIFPTYYSCYNFTELVSAKVMRLLLQVLSFCENKIKNPNAMGEFVDVIFYILVQRQQGINGHCVSWAKNDWNPRTERGCVFIEDLCHTLVSAFSK